MIRCEAFLDDLNVAGEQSNYTVLLRWFFLLFADSAAGELCFIEFVAFGEQLIRRADRGAATALLLTALFEWMDAVDLSLSLLKTSSPAAIVCPFNCFYWFSGSTDKRKGVSLDLTKRPFEDGFLWFFPWQSRPTKCDLEKQRYFNYKWLRFIKLMSRLCFQVLGSACKA